ncbi:MAG: DUF1573 domain-containing protein [Mariprofundaceae bacterium]
MIRFTSVLMMLLIAACGGKADLAKEIGEEGKADGLIFQPVEVDLGEVKEGTTVEATFFLRNESNKIIQIADVSAACGCTIAEPETYILAAGEFTRLHVQIDTTAKLGSLKKSVDVTDMSGHTISAFLHMDVVANPHASSMNQGSIFDGQCATCHVDPAKGKKRGSEVYAAVCVMCHGADAVGAYAPSLRGHQDAQSLVQLIANGTGSNVMPGFAEKHGGPLTDVQIHRLTQWLISLD